MDARPTTPPPLRLLERPQRRTATPRAPTPPPLAWWRRWLGVTG